MSLKEILYCKIFRLLRVNLAIGPPVLAQVTGRLSPPGILRLILLESAAWGAEGRKSKEKIQKGNDLSPEKAPGGGGLS